MAAWIAECARQGVRAGEIAVFVRSDAELERGRRAASIAGLAHHVLDELVETDTDEVSIAPHDPVQMASSPIVWIGSGTSKWVRANPPRQPPVAE